MTAVWVTVAAVGLATIAIKAAGPVLVGTRQLPPRARSALEHLAPALLAALVVTQAVGGDDGFAVDARLVGLAAAAVALALRAPLLVVVIVAATTAALTRALL